MGDVEKKGIVLDFVLGICDEGDGMGWDRVRSI